MVNYYDIIDQLKKEIKSLKEKSPPDNLICHIIRLAITQMG